MAHFVKLDENNIVENVIVVNNYDCNGGEYPTADEQGNIFCNKLIPGRWIQTSYNSNFRHIYAGIGYYYDEVNDVFIAPKPYPSWHLNENFDWQAPIEMPNNFCYWDEDSLSWIEYEIKKEV